MNKHHFMEQVKRSIISGVGTTLSVVGIATGVATTTLAAMHALPVVVIAGSVIAPAALGFGLFFGSGLLTRLELKQLREDSERRQKQLEESEKQLAVFKELCEKQKQDIEELGKTKDELKEITDTQKTQIDERDKQLKEQEQQITKLFEIHTQLKETLKNLLICGDSFNQFEQVLSNHVETLSQKIEHLNETSSNLDQTAHMLSDLTNSLENHINNDRSLMQNRELLFHEH